VLLFGVARFGTGGWLHDIGGVVYASIAAGGSVGAAVWASRRPQAWSPAALLGALAALIAGGFTFATWITHSQLPVALPGTLARGIVAVLIGAGAGVVVSS